MAAQKRQQRKRTAKSKAKSKTTRKRRSRKRGTSAGWTLPDLSFLSSPILWAGLLFLFAFLTAGTLLAPDSGTLLAWWQGRVRRLVGEGVYVAPLAAAAIAWWLLRYGVQQHQGDAEAAPPTWRIVGVLLIVASITGTLHLFAFAADPQALAEAGGGGGAVGLVVSDLLVRLLGLWVTIPTLALMFLLGVMLAFALSPQEVVQAPAQVWRWLRRRPAEPEEPAPWEEVPTVDVPEAYAPWWRRLWQRLHAWRRPAAPPVPPRIVGEEQGEETPPVSPYTPTADVVPEPMPTPPPAEPQPTAPAAASTQVSPAQPRPRPALEASTTGHTWQLPDIRSIFEDVEESDISAEEIRQRSRIIEETLASFGVPARVIEVHPGPTVTQFGVQPGYIERVDRKTGTVRRERVKVSRIVALQNDLALALAAAPIRIQAPVPGKPYIGIEVPNKQVSLVTLRSVLESDVWRTFKGRLKIALGRDVAGRPVVADLARMPHLLIAGATGSGKSVCINAILACLMATKTPDEVRFILIDPKRVEMSLYNGVPHLVGEVVTDVEMTVDVLQWAVKEMERRYLLFAETRVRDIVQYNRKAARSGGEKPPLPYMVIVIDELADLMLAAPDEVERAIVRLAQMARATGIHLVVATQRPSVDVVTGLIKANFPARIAFAVASQVDSRVILDTPGAEQLLGRGDMLFMPPDSSKLARLQGVYVSDREIQRLVGFWKAQRPATPDVTDTASPSKEKAPETPAEPSAPSPEPATSPEPAASPTSQWEQPSLWEDLLEDIKEQQAEAGRDPLFDEAVRVVREANRASISLLQRRLKIGYARAGRLIDQLEEAGIIGPDPGGGRSRVVYPPRSETETAAPPAEEDNTAADTRFASEAEETPSEDKRPRRPRLWF